MRDAGPVDGVTGRKVVSTVKHQIHFTNQPFKQCIIGPLDHRKHGHVRIECRDGMHHRLRLELANSSHGVGNLALQVGCIHTVMINQGNVSNSGATQVQGHWRAQAASANDQHMGRKELFLAFNAYFIKQDMPGIAKQLFVVHEEEKAGKKDAPAG